MTSLGGGVSPMAPLSRTRRSAKRMSNRTEPMGTACDQALGVNKPYRAYRYSLRSGSRRVINRTEPAGTACAGGWNS